MNLLVVIARTCQYVVAGTKQSVMGIKGRSPRSLCSLAMTAIFVSLLIARPSSLLAASATPSNFFKQGTELYNAGRYSDAVEAFEQAIKRRDKSQDAQAYIDRIRKETVERIRNKALTGVNKSNWQSKYYFLNTIDNRVRVGISAQELFERQSANFRPGAVEALAELANIISRADTSRFDVELINEINQDTASNPPIAAQQMAAVFSYLSLAARNSLPKFNPPAPN